MAAHYHSIISLFLLCLIRTGYASDAKSFFAYIKEIAEPSPAALSNGRESRQGPLSLVFSLNGASNFTFNVANIPTNFPIACGGDDRNYCNYPDLPLIETYDLNYYSRRPIPSGRCPDGYSKMPTFDCLNIAPALFETTCCMFLSTTPNICSASVQVDALWSLCNGSIYISSGAYAWQYDSNWNFVQGPVLLSGLTGGCVSRDLAEAEVDGQCNVQFFNLNDQYFITDYQTGSLGCTGPSLVTNLGITGAPHLVYGLGRSTIIYHIDGDGFQAVIGDGYNFICGGNVTNNIGIQPPSSVAGSPYINCSAATYIASRDVICYVCLQSGTNNVLCTTRAGVAVSTATLSSTLSNCNAAVAASAPLVYIPYPIYPVFTGQQSPSPAPAPASSYSASPSSYSMSPSPAYG
jgi:hypothetical protein